MQFFEGISFDVADYFFDDFHNPMIAVNHFVGQFVFYHH